ncbi:2-succinylbenzoate--CoA ligase [Paraferrimonas sedimenticola]|uniref:2-succinylbenzoate-CoA ligase n=1 Tax=Paraferrimonas sedimenticola TaxID=375674 RepID=A0AA37RZ33_9GAMM|nr:2-succinylbenzoate--CoA ligase [Paraferrimonas sedimenticola]GLP97823.1 2-succinylbenzoate-CoA ligase [Paraferrimonas sedimenticola]
MAVIDCPIEAQARRDADAIAIRTPKAAISYTELHQAIDCLAAQLSDLLPGAIIGYVGHNSELMVTLFWACARNGWVFCPLSPRWTQAQILEFVQTHQLARLYVAEGIECEALAGETLACEPLCWPNNSSETAVVVGKQLDDSAPVNAILTSGSSGQPKAAVHSLANHIASARGSASLIPLTSDDSWLLSLPLFHIGGLAIVVRCALAGACIALPDPKLSLGDNLIALQPSHLSLVDAQCKSLWQSANTREALLQAKALLLGGSAISTETLERLAQHQLPAFISYGLTEMSSQVCTASANAQGLCGEVLPERELKIDERGHILLRGATRFLGYLNKGVLQRLPTDSWFDSKDLGQWQQGQLKILGRADNRFVCGGENLQPETVESALLKHPKIQQALVYPLADERFGYLPHAIIDAQVELTQEQLDQHLAELLPRFMRPRSYQAWPQLPPSAGIKPNRKAIIQAICG